MAELTVSKVMGIPPVIVPPDVSLRAVAVSLCTADVGAAVVLRGEEVIGVLTERDVVRALAEDADPDTVWSGDVMSSDPIWVGPDDSLERALQLMVEAGVRHLAVMDGDELVGVVSLRDVALALRSAL